MAEVSVSIAGRSYRMACDDGQEEHLHELSKAVDDKINAMRKSFGEIGDLRLTVMASVVLADELSDLRRQVEAMRSDTAQLKSADQEELDARRAGEFETAAAIDAVVKRLEAVAKELNAGRRDAGTGADEDDALN
ncbi:cell division protein ZapA [Terrihabitans rhizophilus]|uniref:Cell division protein ZapA n=1 Tax=Terrihabitans rhizophilus TaxID=3092662 RepID=A0ABU4RV28_9HYPH|nr:cell division protein ZapA [Terrihabitans sp. PJ23]MDX6806716.1 cell division protein ZapA [Terrihabitans sp. PJ23]